VKGRFCASPSRICGSFFCAIATIFWKIEAARCCATFGRTGRDIAGTTTNVENKHAPSNLGGIEKRWNELPGRACPDGVVLAGNALPAFVFKFSECFHCVRQIKKNIDFSLDVLPFFPRRWQALGMKKRQGAYREFTNIRILPSGYQVAITRNKKEYSKHFAGHSKDSLKAAHHWRDRVLRLLPNKRSQPIPARILSKLRLKQPVVGVSRYETRRFYSVTYHGAKGRTRVRTFSWRDPKGELAAYAAAIKFRRRKTKFR
jgi:hypothetical protein